MTMSIEEFKEIYKTSTQQTDAPEEQAEETIQKEIDYPNSTYRVVSKIGYLIGVPKEIFDRGAAGWGALCQNESKQKCTDHSKLVPDPERH